MGAHQQIMADTMTRRNIAMCRSISRALDRNMNCPVRQLRRIRDQRSWVSRRGKRGISRRIRRSMNCLERVCIMRYAILLPFEIPVLFPCFPFGRGFRLSRTQMSPSSRYCSLELHFLDHRQRFWGYRRSQSMCLAGLLRQAFGCRARWRESVPLSDNTSSAFLGLVSIYMRNNTFG